MSIPKAMPNEIIDLMKGMDAIAEQKTTSLFKSNQFEVIRMMLPKGNIIAEHKAPGEITVQCLAGRIAFTSDGKTHELSPGQMLYLTAGQPHALEAKEHSSVLVTIMLASKAG